jgi:hypothetical protein
MLTLTSLKFILAHTLDCIAQAACKVLPVDVGVFYWQNGSAFIDLWKERKTQPGPDSWRLRLGRFEVEVYL